MAIEEDPTRGSEPARGAARLFAALLVNDSFCWTRITHKLRHREEKKAVKCHQNRRSYQHHPSAARGKARPPQQAAISFLPLSLPYIFYSIHRCSKKSTCCCIFSRITRFNRIELRYHRPHRRCGPVALRGEAALKPSRVVDCAP